MKTYLLFLLIAIDQFINALLRGMPDETLSSRAWRMHVKKQRYWGWTCGFIDWIAFNFFGQTDHCRKSFEEEFYGAQLPPGIRERIDA